MAKKTTVQLVDDLDGSSEAAETVAFGLDGNSYEIDLSDDHAARLRDALAEYVAAARRAGGGRRAGSGAGAASSGGRSGSRSGGGDRQKVGEMRAWAKEQGMKVSERGRISGEVVAAYEAAH